VVVADHHQSPSHTKHDKFCKKGVPQKGTSDGNEYRKSVLVCVDCSLAGPMILLFAACALQMLL